MHFGDDQVDEEEKQKHLEGIDRAQEAIEASMNCNDSEEEVESFNRSHTPPNVKQRVLHQSNSLRQKSILKERQFGVKPLRFPCSGLTTFIT